MENTFPARSLNAGGGAVVLVLVGAGVALTSGALRGPLGLAVAKSEATAGQGSKDGKKPEVPLEFVLDPRNHEYRSMHYKGQQRRYYVIPYENRFIWGATAAMLVGFARRLRNPLLP